MQEVSLSSQRGSGCDYRETYLYSVRDSTGDEYLKCNQQSVTWHYQTSVPEILHLHLKHIQCTEKKNIECSSLSVHLHIWERNLKYISKIYILYIDICGINRKAHGEPGSIKKKNLSASTSCVFLFKWQVNALNKVDGPDGILVREKSINPK